ncbi:hypothetical protein FALCPG4_003271 [Fusarium falciforme]
MDGLLRFTMTKLAWSKAGPRLVPGSMIGRDGLMTAISKAVRRTEDRTLEGSLSFALLCFTVDDCTSLIIHTFLNDSPQLCHASWMVSPYPGPSRNLDTGRDPAPPASAALPSPGRPSILCPDGLVRSL